MRPVCKLTSVHLSSCRSCAESSITDSKRRCSLDSMMLIGVGLKSWKRVQVKHKSQGLGLEQPVSIMYAHVTAGTHSLLACDLQAYTSVPQCAWRQRPMGTL